MAVIAWSAAVPLMLIEEGGWMLLEREHQDRRMRTYTFRYPLPCPSSCLEKVPSSLRARTTAPPVFYLVSRGHAPLSLQVFVVTLGTVMQLQQLTPVRWSLAS